MYLVNLTDTFVHVAGKEPFALKPEDKKDILEIMNGCNPWLDKHEEMNFRARLIAAKLSQALSTPMLFKHVGIDYSFVTSPEHCKFALDISEATVVIEPPLVIVVQLLEAFKKEGLTLIFPPKEKA